MKPIQYFLEFAGNRTPGQLVVQLTNHCNARCPQCGMRVTEPFPRSTLAKDTVKRIIDQAARNNVAALSFTGGEVTLFLDDLAELIHYAHQAGIPYIRTGTNGFLLRWTDEKASRIRIERVVEKLASTPLRNFWISIDSAVPRVHEKMRGFSGLIKGIEKAIPVFHEHGLYPTANLGINRNMGGEKPEESRGRDKSEKAGDLPREEFGRDFENYFRFVCDLGFTIVNACYPMSVAPEQEALSAVYGATSTDDVVSYTEEEKAALFSALGEAIEAFRHRLRIFTPRSSLYALARSYGGDNGFEPYPCRGGLDYFFVDPVEGDVFPCGYRGKDNLGKYWDLPRSTSHDTPPCRRCDWECFRDPSEFLGPVLDLSFRPSRMAKRLWKDPRSIRLWLEDLSYYRACSFFDGRRGPDGKRLERFRKRS